MTEYWRKGNKLPLSAPGVISDDPVRYLRDGGVISASVAQEAFAVPGAVHAEAISGCETTIEDLVGHLADVVRRMAETYRSLPFEVRMDLERHLGIPATQKEDG